jgi:hypothetical protein
MTKLTAIPAKGDLSTAPGAFGGSVIPRHYRFHIGLLQRIVEEVMSRSDRRGRTRHFCSPSFGATIGFPGF